jgi:hypothetical protein
MASYASEPLKNFGANRMDNLAGTNPTEPKEITDEFIERKPEIPTSSPGRTYLEEGGTPSLSKKGLSKNSRDLVYKRDEEFSPIHSNYDDPTVEPPSIPDDFAKRQIDLKDFAKGAYKKSQEPWYSQFSKRSPIEMAMAGMGAFTHHPIAGGIPLLADLIGSSPLAQSTLGYGAYQLGDLLGKANGLRPVMDTAPNFSLLPKFPSFSDFMKDQSGHMGGFGTGWESPLKPKPQLEKPLGTVEGPQVPPMKPRVEPDYPLTPFPFFNPEKPFDIKDFLKNEEGSIKNPFEGLFGKKPLSNLTETGPVDKNAMDQYTGFGQGGGTPLNLSGKVLPFDTGGDIESLLGGAKESSPNEMQWFHSGKEGPIPINSLKGNFKAGDPDKAFKLYDTPPPPLQFPKRNIEGFGPSNPRPMPTDFADKPNALQNQIVATHPRQNFEPTIVQPDQFTSGFPQEGTAGSEIPHMNDIFDRLNTLRQNESKAYQNSLVKPGRQSNEPTNFKEMLMKLLKDDSGFTKFPEATPTSNKLVRGVEIPNNLGVNAGGTMENLGLNGYRVLPPQKVVPKQIPDVLGGEDLGKGGYNIIKNEDKKSTTIPSPIEQQILNALNPSGGRIDLPDDGTPYSTYKIKK